MITIIQVPSNPARFDIAMQDLATASMDKREIAEAYIEQTGDLWFPFTLDGQPIGTEGFSNPVDAGKLAIPDFANRAIRNLDATIERVAGEITKAREVNPESRLLVVRERMLDGLKRTRDEFTQ